MAMRDIGFDKSKVEYFNCHKREHFARECRAPRNQDNKNKESLRRSVHVETSTSLALVSRDGLDGYDWSDKAKEVPNYALMAFSSSSPDSKDQGVIDSGYSRHMTGNMSYLTDYEEIDGGYVTFGGNPKGGKITGKGQVERRQKLSNITFCYHYGLLIHHIPKIQRVLMMMDPNLQVMMERRLMKIQEKLNQEKEDNVNSTNNVNTVDAASINEVNVVSEKTSIELPFYLNMPALEDYIIFDFSGDDEDDGAVADMNNLDTTIQVSPNPTTRIHKDRHLDQVIEDLQSATQTRKMSKNLEEHGFMSSMGELTFFLGLQVKQKKDGIFISQDKYVAEILKKIGFIEVKTASTPMETQKPLLKDEDGEEVDVHIYQVNLKVSHLHVVKRIFRYLKGQPILGLWYPKDSPFDSVAYTDSDYAGASLDRKSTTGDTHNMVAFLSKPTESDGFEQIVDFLNAHPIRYALTINPTIYISCIEQFWSTVMAKTINGEEQLHALVDGKKIIITESSVRRDLQLADEEGVDCIESIIASLTAEEKAQRRLELKARSTLLMGIPNKHQLKFNSIKDAKSLLQAIKKRFGGNDATKKTQRNLLKQQYENFTASKLKDVNQKFLRSLSLEWKTHTIMWRNKPEINTLSLDDLYNNMKIYEPEVKETSSSSTNTQNVAFVSSDSTSSTNEVVNTAHDVTTASTQATAINSTTIDNLKEMDLRCQMAMLTIRAWRFLKNTRRKLTVNGNETIRFDKSKVECYNYHKRGHFARKCRAPRNQENRNRENTRRVVPVEITTSNALVSCDGSGYD
ncbi:ribonuclease H-like domain-containing protein [Tanacetum coccineum]